MIFIGNRYEIIERIDFVEENRLYEAYDSHENKKIKIKIIEDNSYIKSNFPENLLNEAQIIRKFDSPYILKILDVGIHKTIDTKLYYIIYENFNGISLHTLSKASYLHLDELTNIGIQIAKALQSYYKIGKYHGSLKLDDILVDDNYNIKISDFGLTESNLGTNIRCSGNLQYLSPSQLSVDFTDIKTDLFEFGIIMYEAAFKKYPFERFFSEKDAIKKINKISNWSSLPVNEDNKKLIKIIKKLMERNVGLSYENYEQVIVDFSKILYKKIDERKSPTSKMQTVEAALDVVGRLSPEELYKTEEVSLEKIEKAIKQVEKNNMIKNKEENGMNIDEEEHKKINIENVESENTSNKTGILKKLLFTLIIFLILFMIFIIFL